MSTENENLKTEKDKKHKIAWNTWLVAADYKSSLTKEDREWLENFDVEWAKKDQDARRRDVMSKRSFEKDVSEIETYETQIDEIQILKNEILDMDPFQIQNEIEIVKIFCLKNSVLYDFDFTQNLYKKHPYFFIKTKVVKFTFTSNAQKILKRKNKPHNLGFFSAKKLSKIYIQ